jgi:hypothetical protein
LHLSSRTTFGNAIKSKKTTDLPWYFSFVWFDLMTFENSKKGSSLMISKTLVGIIVGATVN